MTRTEAPNDLGGKLFLNDALTTPELPISFNQPQPSRIDPDAKTRPDGTRRDLKRTMCLPDLAPDDAVFGAAHGRRRAVYEGDFFAEVESGLVGSASSCSCLCLFLRPWLGLCIFMFLCMQAGRVYWGGGMGTRTERLRCRARLLARAGLCWGWCCVCRAGSLGGGL